MGHFKAFYCVYCIIMETELQYYYGGRIAVFFLQFKHMSKKQVSIFFLILGQLQRMSSRTLHVIAESPK